LPNPANILQAKILINSLNAIQKLHIMKIWKKDFLEYVKTDEPKNTHLIVGNFIYAGCYKYNLFTKEP
jgi:hypothetical protein